MHQVSSRLPSYQGPRIPSVGCARRVDMQVPYLWQKFMVDSPKPLVLLHSQTLSNVNLEHWAPFSIKGCVCIWYGTRTLSPSEKKAG